MAIVQGVEHPVSVAVTCNHTQHPEQPEVLGYGRLGHVRELSQIAGAQFLVEQSIDNLDAAWVAQRPERLSCPSIVVRWPEEPPTIGYAPFCV